MLTTNSLLLGTTECFRLREVKSGSKVRRQFLRTGGPRSLERVSKLGGLEGRKGLVTELGKRGSVTNLQCGPRKRG